MLDDIQIFAKINANISKVAKAPPSLTQIIDKKSTSSVPNVAKSIASPSPSTVTSVTAISDDDISTTSNSSSNQSMSKLINELNAMKEKEKSYLEKMTTLEEENEKFKTIAIEFEQIFRNLIKDKDESETKLKNEIIELTKERDHLQEDVIGVERAFDDLHRRFEKLKTKVEEFKKVLNLILNNFISRVSVILIIFLI